MFGAFRKKNIAEFKRYVQFIIVGLSGALVVFVITFVFTEYLKFWYLVAYIMATLIGWTYNFIINSKFTFDKYNEINLMKRYGFYMQGYALLSLVAFFTVYVLTSILHVHYLLSIFVISVFMSIITFKFNRKFIFRDID